MEVILYYNASDDRVINKTLIGGESFVGQARDEVDIMSPVRMMGFCATTMRIFPSSSVTM